MKTDIRKISNSFIAVLFCLVCFILCYKILISGRSDLYEIIKHKENGSITDEFESKINSTFPMKDYFVDINGLFHRMALQREMNKVILLSNGMETEPVPNVEDSGIMANVASVKGLSDWLAKKDIDFLYCQVPWKIDDENNLLPAGVTDYSNRIADVFLEGLEAEGVDNLDLRKCMRDDGIDRYDMFLVTEHHWSPEGGFYAFQKICDHLRERYGEDIPDYVTEAENYEHETYENGSLGYYANRTGWMFAGFDDFTLIYPKWETRQSSWAPHKELFREGSFYDAIFYTEYLEKKWRERGLYATYIGGDWPVVVHHSETAPVDKNVMILIDSFGTIPESFLTTVYKNVIGLDLRWVLRNNIGKTTAEFVEEYDPNIVIIMFNPNQIGSQESEQFQYGIERPD